MARLFVAASTQYLELGSAVLTAHPLTMACWYRPTTVAATYGLMTLFGSVSSDQFGIRATSTAHLQVAIRDSGGTVSASTASSIVANTWYHVCAVFTSTTSRTIYQDGANAVSETTSKTPASINRTGIGEITTAGNVANGRIADAAIWSVALTTDEITALANRMSPLRIRRGSLAAYWPLYGFQSPEQDIVGANSLTLTGAPTSADHAPVGTFSRRFSLATHGPITAAAPPSATNAGLLLIGAGAGA